MAMNKYVILQEGKDYTVLCLAYGVYKKMVTFHYEAWGDDALGAAEEYIDQRNKRNQEIADMFSSMTYEINGVRNGWLK